MVTRRKFIRASAFTGIAGLMANRSFATPLDEGVKGKPTIITTWKDNVRSNEAAWSVLGNNGRAVDAVVTGVQVAEADPNDNSVGYGGLPDRDGKVTLDACLMDEFGNCGSVMALEHIIHPILVAKAVMEKTPHVQLVGEGALRFALSQGFKKEKLLTERSEKAWKEWLKTSKYDPMDTLKEFEKAMKKDDEPMPWPAADLNHDTIGMIALDTHGNLGGACTTSGMAYKMHGRVGDSPIIGAGLYVDPEIGAATSSGVGEEVVRVCGSHTVTEAMRRGLSPEAACREAVNRIVKWRKNEAKKLQVGFIAINNRGQVGAFAIKQGFTYCVTTKTGTQKFDSKSFYPAGT